MPPNDPETSAPLPSSSKSFPSKTSLPPGSAPHVPPSPLSRLKSVYFSVFIDVLGIGLVIPVLPYLILSFEGAGASEVGFVIAFYSLCQVPGSFIFGAISDRKGRRPVLLLSIFASSLSFLLCGLAKTLPMVIIARGFSGLTGGSISVAQAYVADVTTVEERPKYLGLIGATIGIAFTFGPGIGAATAAIVEANGGDIQLQYSAVFFLASAFGLLGFIFALKNLEETSLPTDKASMEVKASVERSLLLPILIISFSMFSSNFGFTVMQSTYGVLITDEYDWSTKALGLILVVSGLEIAVLQGKIVKVIVQKIGKHVSGFLGCALLGLGLACLPLTLWSKPVHLFSFAVQVAGFSVTQTALPALLSRYASKDSQGSVLGFGQAAQAASRVVAPLVSGVLYDNSEKLIGMEYAAPYLLGGILSVVSGLPLLGLLNDRRLEKGVVEDEDKDEGDEMIRVEEGDDDRL
ncbi:hypothetical protein TrST_g12207 [Triparma strigata]|uniref:Major facilitator superfamily (MFS) profile domain-containing protein n=1 Tax=Triparma strigata TaxID=1606541 RepID=A0A9W7B2E9_9STRA|nr:hypothetical protein TrST_g12207 [Triparma strigata]